MLIPDYDVDNNPPVTKMDALSYKDAVRCPAWQEACCNLPEDRLCNYKEYYVAINPQEQKLSVPANMFIGTSNNADAGPTSGEVWVEYDITLSCPTKSSIGSDIFASDASPPGSLFLYDYSIANAKDFAGRPYLEANGQYSSDGTIDSIVLQPGRYFLDWAYNDAIAAGGIVVTPVIGSSIYNKEGGTSSAVTLRASSSTATQVMYSWSFTVVANSSIFARTLQLGIVDPVGTGNPADVIFLWCLTKIA